MWCKITEYQKIIHLFDNTGKQLFKFRAKNWVEINDDARGTYNTSSQIKFETTMLKSNLCDYSDAYILVKGTIIGGFIGRFLGPLFKKRAYH